MIKNDFSELESITTPEIQTETRDKDVVFIGSGKYMDADDELLKITKWIKENSPHNSEIKPEKIKYLYTTTTKKDGGRFVLGSLVLRSEIEKMVNDSCDYILFVNYKTWKELDIKHKIIQLDKILCGIFIDDMENKTKKMSVDSKEYINNLRHYGPEDVLNSSEIIDMATQRIVQQEKEERKAMKEKIKKDEE